MLYAHYNSKNAWKEFSAKHGHRCTKLEGTLKGQEAHLSKPSDNQNKISFWNLIDKLFYSVLQWLCQLSKEPCQTTLPYIQT